MVFCRLDWSMELGGAAQDLYHTYHKEGLEEFFLRRLIWRKVALGNHHCYVVHKDISNHCYAVCKDTSNHCPQRNHSQTIAMQPTDISDVSLQHDTVWWDNAIILWLLLDCVGVWSSPNVQKQKFKLVDQKSYVLCLGQLANQLWWQMIHSTMKTTDDLLTFLL